MKRFVRKKWHEFVYAQRGKNGSVLILFALSAMILLAVSALAVDFGLAYSQRDKLQRATDAAALAAATLLDASDSERKDRGQRVFEANYTTAGALLSLDIEGTEPNNRFVNATVDRSLPTHILPLFGLPNIDLKTQSRSPIPRVLNVEVAMVLDYSDSMITNSKYVRMRDAALAMIDSVSLNGENSRASFAVVPFAAMVKANLPMWALRSDATSTECTQDRRAPYNAEETAPSVTNDTKWGEVTSGHSCSDMGSLGLDVIPLTNNHQWVKDKIAAMEPYKWTHIALGAELGWQMISPTGVYGGAKAYDTNKTIKVVILLTDGMQTAPGWGTDGTKSVINAEKNLINLCNGMKAKEVKVFTIGYDLSDTHTKDLLKDCANAGKFYDASDVNSGLMATFTDIGEQVREEMVRLSE
ncbi:MAG: pilus assembly protein TadG-related protein [Filomicrobium sp.]